MSEFECYCRGTDGNDSNDGLFYATAKKTLAAALVVAVAAIGAGATRAYVSCSEMARGGSPASATVNNVTIRQHQNIGLERFRWKGGTVLSGTWTANGAAWQLDGVGTGLTVGAVLYNWDELVNGRGSHYGTCKTEASAAAVVSAASGAQGNVFYDSGTAGGRITGYFGGANPNTSGKTIEYVARHDVIAIELTGTGNVVDGIWGECWHNNGQGAFVWLKNGTGSSEVVRVRVIDGGPHAIVISGQSALMANARIVSCSSRGAKYNASHFTFFQQGGFGNTSLLRMTECYVGRHSWFNLDGSEVATCEQTGFYAHSTPGSTCIVDWLRTGCTSWDESIIATPIVDCDHQAAPVDPSIFSNYHSRDDGCSYQNMTKWRPFGHTAARRTIFEFGRQGSSANNTYSPGGNGAFMFLTAATKAYFESCVFPHDSTPTANSQAVIFYAELGVIANVDVRFVNCDFIDISATNNGRTGCSRTMFHLQPANGQNMAFTGCIFTGISEVPDQRDFMYTEPGANTSTIDFSDCAWGLTFDRFIYGAITAAGPANEDPNANIVGDNPFVDAAGGNYRIRPTSALYGDKRVTSAVVPDSLINGPYDGSFGAYAQFDLRGRGGSRLARWEAAGLLKAS